ncbi:DNA translocase FtsK 4TM domain-containing protein, partial [bacterium]|nr:DNA translocase FtsK 4TM domain-containing protein [bacterium]
MAFGIFFKSRRFHEICGILLLMIGILTSISLYSFNKNDPYIFSSNQKSEGQSYKNYAGFIGATISHFLLDSIGYGVFFFTAIIILLSLYELFASKKIIHVIRFLGVIMLFFSFITIFSLTFKTANYKGYIFPSGGELGKFIALYQMKYLNYIGGWLMTCTICLLGFVLLTEISLPKIIRGLGA